MKSQNNKKDWQKPLIIFGYMRYYLFFIYLWLLPIYSFSQNTYIISVGIANYQHINSLRFTENDVISFNQVMEANNTHIVSLIGKEATHTKIIKTILTISAQAKPNDEIIFFFSGHGYEGGFCCYDMKQNSYIGGLNYQEIQILFRNCRAGRKMVIADACFSGGLSKQKSALTVQSVQHGDVVFFLSSKFDETSLELSQGTNGLFSHVLINGLKGQADKNQDKKISFQEIFDYVYYGVTEYAERIPHNQHPTVWGNIEGSTIIKML